MSYLVVTGGAGFIGSNLIALLLEKTNYKIISLDNYSTGKKKNHINDKRVKYIKGNTNNICNILFKYKLKIKTIFHFAEFSRIAQSFKKTDECFDTNIKGSYEVIKFCLDNKIKIIYSATSANLGNQGQDQNLSPYAFSKATNMNLIINLNEWYGLRYEIIYFYNVYGPNQISNHFMSAVIGIFENCFRLNKSLPVVKPGTQRRNFTHVFDTVEACFFAFKQNKNRHYSIFNNKSFSIIDIAKMFSSKVKFVAFRPGERFKSSVIKKIRGYKIYQLKAKTDLIKYINNFKINCKK